MGWDLTAGPSQGLDQKFLVWFPKFHFFLGGGGLGAKGVATPSWPQGCPFPRKALASDGPHIYVVVSLSRAEIGSICMHIMGGQQGSKHRGNKRYNSAQRLCSPSRLWPILMPRGWLLAAPRAPWLGFGLPLGGCAFLPLCVVGKFLVS